MDWLRSIKPLTCPQMGFCFPKSLFLLKKSYMLIKKLINFLSLNKSISEKRFMDLTMVPASDHIYCMNWLGWISLSTKQNQKKIQDLTMVPASYQYLLYEDLVGSLSQGENCAQIRNPNGHVIKQQWAFQCDTHLCVRNRRGDASEPRRLQKTKNDEEEDDVCPKALELQRMCSQM